MQSYFREASPVSWLAFRLFPFAVKAQGLSFDNFIKKIVLFARADGLLPLGEPWLEHFLTR